MKLTLLSFCDICPDECADITKTCKKIGIVIRDDRSGLYYCGETWSYDAAEAKRFSSIMAANKEHNAIVQKQRDIVNDITKQFGG